MKHTTYVCDICGDGHRMECATLRLNEHARAVGGAVVYDGHEPTHWPLAETQVDLCAECSIAVVELLRGRIDA